MQAIRKSVLLKLMVVNVSLVVIGSFIAWFYYSDLRNEINILHANVFDVQVSLDSIVDWESNFISEKDAGQDQTS